MNRIAPAPPATRRHRWLVLSGLTLVVAAFVLTLGRPSVTSSATSFGELLVGQSHGGLGTADGVVPHGTAGVDDDVPAVADLDPRLLRALRQAAAEAADAGIDVRVTSGWRSRRYQEQLFREAVTAHGSKQQAARWVARPGTSAHETGDAVDVGHPEAAAWLAEHGAAYGLCQVYANEAWHFELRPDAVRNGCPRTYADPAHVLS